MRNKLIIAFITLIIKLTTAMAVPALKTRVLLTLDDDSQVWATLVGDEFGHWYVDDYGNTLSLGNDGIARFMSPLEKKEIESQQMSKMNSVNELRTAVNNTVAYSKGQQRASAFSGIKKGLVILVAFADKPMVGGANTEFNSMFNQTGYSKNNHVGSVHDYFLDNSYGQLNLTFDVVGPVTVSNGMNYYGSNDSKGSDKYPGTMVAEACKLADKNVNFKNYDWDGDGYVDQVYIIYAGYAESQGAPANTIWPHQYFLSAANYYGDGPGTLTLDGVKIDRYACSSELTGVSGTTRAGIGTPCHEFSHCLGLRDTYDVDYSGGEGMMNWDLMCSGSYNGPAYNGERPMAYTAFEKWQLGWIDPQELRSPCYISNMPDIYTNPDAAYLISSESNGEECYILENKQDAKWNYYRNGKSMGHGLFITHVDFNTSVWNQNKINDDPSHQRMIFIPADNRYDTNYESDTYPGTRNNTSLTDNSTPAAAIYSGNRRMGKSITDITEKNGMISFSFMGGAGEGGGPEVVTQLSIPSSVTTYVQSGIQLKVTSAPSSLATDLTWYSSNEDVATVTSGWVYGKSEGVAIVYCENASGVRSNTCVVNVTALAPEEITIIPTTLYLPIGSTHQLDYKLVPWNAITSVSWRLIGYSNDVQPVTLTPDGLVTAIAPGVAKIDAVTSNGKISMFCEVTVPPNPDDVRLPEVTSIALGQTVSLDLKVEPEGSYYEATWMSDDESIVKVTPTGNAIGLKVGETTVRVTTDQGLETETVVQVYEPKLYFVVQLRNGDNKMFEVSETPKMTYADGNVVFTTQNGRQEYAAASVLRMIMIDYSTIVTVGDINEDGQTSIADLMHLLKLIENGKMDARGDMNLDYLLDKKDVQELINKIFETKY